MDDYNNIQQLLEQLEREIIDLKTAHSNSPVVKTFSGSITPESTDPITITYESGNNDIISDSYTYSDSILGVVSDNAQSMYYSGQASLPVTVVSTRPILSITQ